MNSQFLNQEKILLALGYVLDQPDQALHIIKSEILKPNWDLPFHATVLLHWYEQRKDKQSATEQLRQLFPLLRARHQYWYAHQDPEESGLPYRAATNPGVLEPLFLTALTWSNESLIQIGNILGEDVLEVMQWHELTIYSMNEVLWHENCGGYCVGESIPSASSFHRFIPMSAEIPTQAQAERMLLKLKKHLTSGEIQMLDAWLLYHGLLRYDFDKQAKELRSQILLCNKEYGFCEGFNLETGVPTTSPKLQSPIVAALIVDLFEN